MKLLIIKLSIITTIVVGIMGIFFASISIDGQLIDKFYWKFSTPKSSMLIIGSSRAMHGLKPDVVYSEFENENKPVNFAFTMAHSPYGKIYLDAIKKKVDPLNKNGVFILEVNPFLLSEKINTSELREETSRINGQYFLNLNPNFEYLLKNYKLPLYALLTKPKNSGMKHTDDGWSNYPKEVSDDLLESNIKTGVVSYQKVFQEAKFSEDRLSSLNETIGFLQKHGNVVLIRMPISKEMLQLEDDFYSEFNTKMEVLANKHEVPYFKFEKMGSDFRFRDMHHLSLKGCLKFSKYLNQLLLDYANNNRK